MQTVFQAAGGSEGLIRLAGAWHRRVMADEVVGRACRQRPRLVVLGVVRDTHAVEFRATGARRIYLPMPPDRPALYRI